MPKIKGSHTAMKSGMVAAETVFRRLAGDVDADYRRALAASWVWPELYAVRNIRPAFRWGLWAGLAYAGVDTYLLRGQRALDVSPRAPTIEHLDRASGSAADRLSQARRQDLPSTGCLRCFISNTNHEENQPPHLRLKDPAAAIAVNYALYDSPETALLPGRGV